MYVSSSIKRTQHGQPLLQVSRISTDQNKQANKNTTKRKPLNLHACWGHLQGLLSLHRTRQTQESFWRSVNKPFRILKRVHPRNILCQEENTSHTTSPGSSPDGGALAPFGKCPQQGFAHQGPCTRRALTNEPTLRGQEAGDVVCCGPTPRPRVDLAVGPGSLPGEL